MPNISSYLFHIPDDYFKMNPVSGVIFDYILEYRYHPRLHYVYVDYIDELDSSPKTIPTKITWKF
jgi:hypothetical protein